MYWLKEKRWFRDWPPPAVRLRHSGAREYESPLLSTWASWNEQDRRCQLNPERHQSGRCDRELPHEHHHGAGQSLVLYQLCLLVRVNSNKGVGSWMYAARARAYSITLSIQHPTLHAWILHLEIAAPIRGVLRYKCIVSVDRLGSRY